MKPAFAVMNPKAKNTKDSCGFTLVELVVVLAIIGILTVLTVPTVGSLLRSAQLTQATQMIINQISLARQTALAHNHVVEVRFYLYTDTSRPFAGAHYQALQVFEIMPTGTFAEATKMQRLPPGIIIDSSSTLSSVFSTTLRSTQTGVSGSYVLPVIGTTYTYSYFRFQLDGSTDLNSTTNWFLTLHNAIDGDALATPPKNFTAITINPLDGSTQTFRP